MYCHVQQIYLYVFIMFGVRVEGLCVEDSRREQGRVRGFRHVTVDLHPMKRNAPDVLWHAHATLFDLRHHSDRHPPTGCGGEP